MDIQFHHLPLNRLYLSPNNPRRTPASPEDHAAMVASIAAKGLIYPLIVDPFDETTERFGVAAGGRRLAAFQELAAEGKVADDHPVLCYACPEGTDPAELASMENIIRAAMHPADQYETFADFVAKGLSVDEIATRFGTSVRTVERRLSLAKVDPSLLDAYRADEMNLDTLMAFTLTTDHALQRKVWTAAQKQPSWSRYDPGFVRSYLTQKSITADSRIARFATVEAYEAAGGRITRDLFAEDDSEIWLDDPQIARDVATERLEERAEKLRSQWKWVDTTLDLVDYGMLHRFGRYQPQPSETEAARLKAISERIQAVYSEHSSDSDTARTELDALRTESASIERKVSRRSIPKAYREKSGCIVGIDMAGRLSITKGLIRPEDKPKAKDLPEDDTVSVVGTHSTGTSRNVAPKPPKCYTDSLGAVMRSLRTARVQTQLARNPQTAYDLLVYELARQLLPGCAPDTWGAKALGINVSPTEPQVRPDRDESFANAVAQQAALLGELGSSLPVELVRGDDPAAAFRAIAALDAPQKANILAYCVACLPRHQLSFDAQRTDALEAAIERLDIEPNVAFRPNAEVFWSRLTKPRNLAIAEEVIGETWARNHAKDRKADLVVHMEQVFADPGSDPDVPAQAYERIHAWAMPGFAAFDPDPVAPVADNDNADDPDESSDSHESPDPGAPEHTDDSDEASLPEFLTD